MGRRMKLVKRRKVGKTNTRQIERKVVSYSKYLYQFIFTTDEKPTVVYPIPDEIPTTLALSSVNWCKIYDFTLNIMDLHHKMSQTINNNNKNTK